MSTLSPASIADALSRLQADPARFDAALSAHGDASTLRPVLLRALETRHAHDAAGAEVTQVADILRRDQKFAPPGRPSVHLVKLRNQQASTRQAALVARQAHAQAAQAFARALSLPISEKRTPTESFSRWLARHLD